MQSQQPLNIVFTEKFYNETEELTSVADKLSFPLPEISQSAQLEKFFTDNPSFKKGLNAIIDALHQWLMEQGCSQLQKIDTNIKTFKKDFIDYSGSNIKVNATVIYLYQYGTVHLNQILQLIKNKNIPLSTRKKCVENLFLDIAVCGPGAYTHIQNAYSELASTLDMTTEFKNIRTTFARQALARCLLWNIVSSITNARK